MTTFGLILREMAYRKLNFLLSVLAIVIAVTLFVSFFTTGEASKRETTRLMRDIGFNLRIIPERTDMDDFWIAGFSRHSMPEEYVELMTSRRDLLYNHLVATLQRTVSWRDRTIILTGISEEVAPPGKRKSPMIAPVEPGTVRVGFQLARGQGLEEGDEIDILGRRFTVAQCMPESGSDEDVRVYGDLADVQGLLGLEGQINEIKALECLCLTATGDRLTDLRSQLEEILTEAKVIKIQAIALARQSTRAMIERYFGLGMPFVLVVCAAWVGLLAMLNVRQRRQEIGILRALGYGSARVASLFLGKAVIVGALGAGLGFAIGTALALKFGPGVFEVTAKMIKPAFGLLYWLLPVSPAFAALASLIPTMVAVTQDPAVTLREE